MMTRRLLISTSLLILCLAVRGSSQEAPKRATERDFQLLQRSCEKCRSPRDALLLIQEFRHRNKVLPPISTNLEEEVAEWERRSAEGLVRMGEEWVTPEVRLEADRVAKALIEESFALIRVNDHEGFRIALEEASAANKDGWLADYLLGLHYSLNNSPEEGKRCFKKVLSRSPSNVGAMNNLAVCELKDGNGAAALTQWSNAAELAPTNPEIIHNLGRVVYEQGKKRLRISKSVFEKYRKLYSSLASTADADTNGQLTWKLTPAVAGEEARPGNEAADEVANLVSLGGQGTGFFIAKNLLLTNRHVVKDEDYGSAEAIQVSIPAGPNKTALARAEVVAISDDHDLAILRCESLDLPPVVLSANTPKLGAEVMALGYPRTSILGLGIKSTQGIIAGLPTDDEGMLLYDVAINPGNSGGPLFDRSGRVVSINTFFMAVEQEISGGETSTAAIEFIKTHVSDFKGEQGDTVPVEWTVVAEKGSQSTVLVEALFRDAAPAFTSRVGANRMSGSYLVDDACLVCRGAGVMACRNPKCSGGMVQVGYKVPRVVGFGETAREIDVQMFRKVDCPDCANNNVRCPDCRGTGKASR